MRQILIMITLLWIVSANGESYKAPALYGLKGEVKSVKMKSEFPLANRSVSFTEDGLQDKGLFAYDKEGYPIGFGTYFGNDLILMNVFYDDSHKPSVIKYRADTKDDSTEFTCTVSYDGDRVKETEIVFPNRTIIMTYSNEVFDPQGNWTQRDVKEMVMSGDNKTSESDKEYKETREIRYYK